MKCIDCGRTFLTGDYILYSHRGCYCSNRRNCFERENMKHSGLEITVRVDGKEVPLDTISTETFEAIKALEKPKEIPVPVARLATCGGDPRLLFRPTTDIHLMVGSIYSFDLKHGTLCLRWTLGMDRETITRNYADAKPL